MLTARKLVQKWLLQTESSLRGILRGFGLKVGKTTPVGFEDLPLSTAPSVCFFLNRRGQLSSAFAAGQIRRHTRPEGA
jgi:hypothetical protein